MSDEVSQFLEQVERLRGQQIEEDDVRARELEDYLAAKRERQARREERARSISPQKSSPANTPSPRSSRRSIHLSEALRLDSPGPSRDGSASQSGSPEAKPDATMDFSSSPTKENESPLDVDTKSATTPPTRYSALSWQRRPNSRGGPTRPLSMLATQNATQRSFIGSQDPPAPAPVSATEQTFSKDQIAQSLGSKDPSWFRQTADRGANSAAYRKNHVEDTDRLDMATVKAQLPGMSAEEPKSSPPVEEPATPTKMRLATPPTLNPPGFDAGDDKPLGDRLPSPGRMSPTRSNSRSNSPTKGMGGFVQSAMMKRSDSVKRWSVTGPPGLTRANSIQSNQGGGLSVNPRPQSMAQPGSTTPGSSRPTSRHGESDNEVTPKAPTIDTTIEAVAVPSSPSKTMDPRRWSPTKSSWLESALNKPPESPKSHHKSSQSQPAWLAELNKNKGGVPGTEGTRPRPGSISHKHQVSIGGLMRSTPMGTATKTNTTGLGGIYSPPPGGNRPFSSHGANFSISKSAPKLESGSPTEDKMAQSDSEPVPDPELTEEEKKTSEPAKDEELVSPREVKPFAPVPKPKPETPPKKDFRSSLRHRPTGSDAPKTQEPEFKNVFGTLRRTKTSNYVPPDELKDNILKGKASLNQTGGPKKAERVDDFKEAILKKKDDFKKAQADGKGISRGNTPTNDSPLPEGLAKRAEMARRKSVAEIKSAPAPSKPDTPKPTPGPKRIPSQTPSSPKPVPKSAPEPADEGLKRAVTESNTKPEEPRAMPVLHKETSSPARLQGRVGGKLAGRFNPALAGMLARGPPPMASNGGKTPEESDSHKPTSTTVTEPSTPGPQLTHMTKGRARGPRRKVPTSAAAPAVAASPAAEPKPVQDKPRPSTPKAAQPVEKKPVEPTPPAEKVEESNPPLSVQQQVAAKAAIRGKPTPTKPTSTEPQDSEPRRFQTRDERTSSFPLKQSGNTEFAPTDYPSPLRIQKTGDAASQPSSPKKLDNNRMSRFLDFASSNGTTSEPAKQPMRLTHQRTGSRSPVKMFQRSLPEPEPSSPTKVDSDPVVSVKNATAMFGGGAQQPPLAAKPSWDPSAPAVVKTPPRASSRPLPEPVRSSPLQVNKTPSRVAARPLPTPPSKEPQTPKAPQTPKSPHTPNEPQTPKTQQTSSAVPPKTPSQGNGNDVASLLTDFFGPKPARAEYKVDAAELLMNRPPTGPLKIQSLSFQVFQISAEGKKTGVASHYERVLFEREMYIAPHSFTNEAGWKRLEFYFWVGDQVTESAADDALLFVQKEAKALGGKVIKMEQGKETTEFLQAFGGVVLIRRGSSNKYDSIAPNMLCGRRYQGQVAFDECDFNPSSLCSGFVYIITSQGKAYIWKGRGCDVTELSAAKLVAIELTLTGELVEVDDGHESASFWSLFEGGSKPHSADHWRLKPNYAKYCSRLFCSDAETRQQVSEIAPFNQHDLSPEHIYVLDAFFEMYIIVGARAQSQYASFRNALDFAQEYAILAAGMEDRPFVPISTVVLEGIPRDLKRVFRFWRDDLSPTATNSNSTGLKRGRSLRVVSLTQALQALRE
ncbi:Ff.00g120390.m01.CDS01 [Fusarium sp. VM40]|nr:Ff.00g120390.m01.CDS01 [Fusarium sp. VM40]